MDTTHSPQGGTRQRGESIWQLLTLVLSGALVGVIPVLINSHLQGRAQLRQVQFDRRLSATLDYSAACHRHAAALAHLASLPSLMALWSAHLNHPDERRLAQLSMDRHVDAALKDYFSTQADLAVQTAHVNALFRTTEVDPSGLGSAPQGTAGPLLGQQDPEDADTAMQRFRAFQATARAHVPELKQSCREAAQWLTERLVNP
jgi:hypothetical protein